MLLSCSHELREYGLYLQQLPAKAAALVSPENETAKGRILKEIRHEWTTTLEMESKIAGSNVLRAHCPHVSFQQYREVATKLEQFDFQVTEEVELLILAWYPPFQMSANLEQIFGELQSAIKGSGKSETAALSSVMACAVRALSRKLCTSQECPQPLALEDDDWAGKVTEALKNRLWSPTSASPCNLSVLSSLTYEHVALTCCLKARM